MPLDPQCQPIADDITGLEADLASSAASGNIQCHRHFHYHVFECPGAVC
jgi:hypothetical protein